MNKMLFINGMGSIRKISDVVNMLSDSNDTALGNGVYIDEHMAISEEDDCEGRKISELYSEKESNVSDVSEMIVHADKTFEKKDCTNAALKREKAIKDAIVISEIISEPMCKKRHHRRGI